MQDLSNHVHANCGQWSKSIKRREALKNDRGALKKQREVLTQDSLKKRAGKP